MTCAETVWLICDSIRTVTSVVIDGTTNAVVGMAAAEDSSAVNVASALVVVIAIDGMIVVELLQEGSVDVAD